MFGLLGVVLYSLLVGFLLRLVWRYANNCDGYIIFSLLFISLMYAQIGMINFVFGIYISGIITIIFLLAFLRVIVTKKMVRKIDIKVVVFGYNRRQKLKILINSL